MPDGHDSSPYHAQRRGGAEENSSEPYPTPITAARISGWGYACHPFLRASAPPREKPKRNIIPDTKFPEEPEGGTPNERGMIVHWRLWRAGFLEAAAILSPLRHRLLEFVVQGGVARGSGQNVFHDVAVHVG